MEIRNFLPIWDKLTASQQSLLTENLIPRQEKKGTVVHNGSLDCAGLFLVETGQLRAYILSEEGREITLYRLFDGDVCLLSAPCILPGMHFDIIIETEKDTAMWVIPPKVYRTLMEQSPAVANYTNELIAGRFSEVMFLMEQIMWQSFDKRLAAFLLEEAQVEGTNRLKITHEAIANHLGTAREVVTRMLRYFQNEGMVKLTRGCVELTDTARLPGSAKHSPRG